MLSKAQACLQLIRPELPIAAGVTVFVGQALALGKFPTFSQVALGFSLGFFLSSSAMIFNDLFDLAVDRINTPHRPLPSGRVSPREAITLGVIAALAAWIIAWFIHPIVLLISLILWLLGFLYNRKLKAAGIWGNLIVSINVAATFLIGGISVRQTTNPLVWIFALIAFCFDLAEEIAGDAMDMEGDKQRASRSLALRFGKPVALCTSAFLFTVVILLTFIPILLGEISLAYIIPIALMDMIIVVFTIRLLKSATPRQGRASMRVLYISATLGLLAFVLSRFLG